MRELRSGLSSMRILLLVLLGLLFVCCGLAQHLFPKPSRQNPTQQQVWNAANEKAKNASAQATPLLLNYFNSSKFRSEIASIPSIANASSQDILQLYRDIVLGAPLSHNFPINPSFAFLDVNLTGMIQSGFIPNYYTASIVEGLLVYAPALADLENYAEVTLMGFPPFVNLSAPTVSEALTRPGYTCVNIYDIAGGCLGFGNASLVANTSYVQNMTILSAVDTGLFVSCCDPFGDSSSLTTTLRQWRTLSQTHRNAFVRSHFLQLLSHFKAETEEESLLLLSQHLEVHKKNGSSPCNTGLFQIQCGFWDGTPGTFENFDHVLWANPQSWGIPFGDVFKRHFTKDYPLLQHGTPGFLASLIGYIEGDVAGAIPFPEGVAFLQLDASGTLGTPFIELAREWALNNSWPVVWNAGFFFNNQNITTYKSMDINDMVLDPFIVRATTDLSISDSDLELSQTTFLDLSNFTANYLKENPNGGDFEVWSKVYSVLLSGVSSELILRYPEQGVCGLSCFAVQKTTGKCVCKTQ